MAGYRDQFSPFRNAPFRCVWIATLISNLGTSIQSVGASWLMTSLTDSFQIVALLQAAASLPIMLFALVGGAMADSFDRRKVLLAAQYLMIAVSMAMTIFAWLGVLTPWLLLLLTFLLGTGIAINNPTWQASTGDLVPREDLARAVALNSIGFNLSRSFGPALGGVIVATSGATAAFALNVVSFAMLVHALHRWQSEPASENALPAEKIGPALVAGLRFVSMSAETLRVLFRSFVFTFAAVTVLALLPVVAVYRLGGGPLVYGAMLAAYGVGAVGGALLSRPLLDRQPPETVIRLAFVCFAAGTLVTGLSSEPLLTAMSLMPCGAAWVMAMSLFNSTIQLNTPRWVVGRVLSVFQTVTFGGMALGSWLWGYVAQAGGIEASHGLAAALLFIGAMLGLRAPLPRQASVAPDSHVPWTEPATVLSIDRQEGEIEVHVIYRVSQEQTDAFLAAMAQRRVSRRRSGARDWTLLQEVDNPACWHEKYSTETWIEYVRHNRRRTREDIALNERLRELNGGRPPEVRRLLKRIV